jgi:hypothetical protein
MKGDINLKYIGGILILLLFGLSFLGFAGGPETTVTYEGKTAYIINKGIIVASIELQNEISKADGKIWLQDCSILTCDLTIKLTPSDDMTLDSTTKLSGTTKDSSLGKSKYDQAMIYTEGEVPYIVMDYRIETINGTETQVLTGTNHTEYRKTASWETFDSDKKPMTLLKGETYIFKLRYLKTNPKEVVDIVPTFYGVEIDSWAWWNAAWTYKLPITINSQVAETLTNFPVRVDLNTSSSTYWNTATCTNVRFVNSDDATELSYELDDAGVTFCGNATNNATFWVKIPSLTTGSYTIYAYIGNTGAASGQNAADVWSNGYRGVYHFSGYTDSLGANGLGTITSTNSTIVTTDKSCGSALSTTGVTYQGTLWTPPVVPFGQTAFVAMTSATTRSSPAGAYTADAKGGFGFDFGVLGANIVRWDWNGGTASGNPNSYFGAGVMTKFGGHRNATAYSAIIRNGVLSNASTTATGTTAPSNTLSLLSVNYSAAHAVFSGVITELRLHNATRNNNWMIAEQAQTNVVGTLDTYSCTPPAINNDWNVKWEHNCVLTTYTDLGTGNLIITGGPGNFTLKAGIDIHGRTLTCTTAPCEFIIWPTLTYS